MGMRNKATATGINSGELSEYVLALSISARVTGTSIAEVNQAVSQTVAADVAAGGRSPHVTQLGALDLVMDEKAVLANVETSAHLTTPNAVVDSLLTVAADVAATIRVPASVHRVEVLGAGGGKSDVTLIGPDDSEYLSLKYGHDAPARYQTPLWSGVKRTYASAGLDIASCEKAYLKAYETFRVGGRRRSNRKGDYGPELRAACDQLLQAVDDIEQYIEQNVASIFDAETAAENLLALFCGPLPSITFVDMMRGETHAVSKSMVESLYVVLGCTTPSVRRRRTDSGRTLDLWVLSDGQEFCHFRTTVSTNPSSGDREVRIPKPQTYVTPVLGFLDNAQALLS
jgi:hypothetical protein